ncbi:MAG: 30S ribosomal protein S9 [Chloroflexi bacterium]|nr:30S ribosomal protein S9 [Chloroflexota bacterium]
MTANATQERYYYGLGRRKSAIARVRLYPGDGSIIVNGQPANEYFGRESLDLKVQQPLRTVDAGGFNVVAKVIGGGLSGQAGAIRLGISRALVVFDEANRKPLRAEGLLTRDPRVKERKKPGLKRARKRPQYTKR